MKFNTGDACLFGSRTFFGIFYKVIPLSKLYFLSINKVLIIMQSDILNIIYYFNEKESKISFIIFLTMRTKF